MHGISFKYISSIRLQERLARAGSDDIRRSSNYPSNTCDRLEVAISDRNVARLCVRQDPGYHRPWSQVVSDALLTCGSTGLRLRLPEGHNLIFGCCLAGHLGCVAVIVQKSMPAVGITGTQVKALPQNIERPISVFGQGTVSSRFRLWLKDKATCATATIDVASNARHILLWWRTGCTLLL